MKQQPRRTNLQPVLPPQRLQRRIAHRHSNQLPQLRMRTRTDEFLPTTVSTTQPRRHAILIRPRPRSEIRRIQTPHRQSLQRRRLRLRHRDHRPRQRPLRQRAIDQQNRIDRPHHRRRHSGSVTFSHPVSVSRHDAGSPAQAAFPCTPAVTTAVTVTFKSFAATTAA